MKKILHSKNILLHSVSSYKKYRMITETTYKRFLLICGMLCVLLIAFAEEIVIGSWNIQGNGRTFAEKEAREVIKFGQSFVRDKHIDILALQEVMLNLQIDTTAFLKQFAKALSEQTGGQWAYTSSAEYALREKKWVKGEYYASCNSDSGLDNAVLYRSDKLVVEDRHSGYPFYFDNFDISKYKMSMNHTNILKISNSNSRFSDVNYFYLINTHMPYNNKENRKRDIGVLRKICDKLYEMDGYSPIFFYGSTNTENENINQDIQILPYSIVDEGAPIILCGDFNTDCNNLLKRQSYLTFTGYVIECCKTTTRGHKRYDHFILNNAANNLKLQGGHRYKPESFFEKKISDHVPIFMSIDIGNF